MKLPFRTRSEKPIDRLMEAAVYAAGGVMVAVILALFYYLAHESRYAFDRKFDYGFRFALAPVSGPYEYRDDIALDPNATLLTANKEGADGLDEKEESILMPDLTVLQGTALFGTGTPLEKLDERDPAAMYRDDWRAMKRADQRQVFHLYGFATPEYKEPRMTLSWQPDASFDPKLSPFDLKLKLVRVPNGVSLGPIEIDLRKQPKGQVELPTFVAKTDDERTKGYVFELVATPTMSNTAATLAGFFRTDWDPTLAYPRYGFVPLLLGTLCITLLALLFAAPIAVACAVYLSDQAPSRLREWIKPIVELLASVPTVVLGYFGLMLIAPALQKTFGAALGLESGRAMLTTALVMAVLLLPTITSVAEDALQAVPNFLREGGEALGLTAKEKLKTIVLPAARSGVWAAVLLGMARAIGETMIVWILSGGTPTMPSVASATEAAATLMKPTRGIPDTVAIEMGNVDFEGVHYGHLFMLGLTLFLITLAINFASQRIGRRTAWRA